LGTDAELAVAQQTILHDSEHPSFVLLPLMHHMKWDNRLVKSLVYVPFVLIMLGVLLSGFSVFGMKAVFFGYGFHF